MAEDRSWDAGDHRRFALRYLPPGELRDGYLEYLDGLAPRVPDRGAAPRAHAGAGGETAGADGGVRPWAARRVLAAAAAAVAFAYGAWAIASRL